MFWRRAWEEVELPEAEGAKLFDPAVQFGRELHVLRRP